MNWQPIETAPKTGEILAYFDGSYAVVIWYFGEWALSYPCLGDALPTMPTLWTPIQPPQKR